MLTVPFAERAIYEMSDAERTPEHVIATLRAIEARLQGLQSGVRPVLAVPHLLSGESSAYYHGYVLAEMASYQTRAFFLERDGALTDNPRIGPDLAAHYWAPGNAVAFDHTVQSLTGQTLSADALAHACNRTVDQSISEARSAVQRAQAHPRAERITDLDATIRVVHGREQIASTERGGIDGLCASFEAWVDGIERSASAS